ncbi:MAG: HAMP domain-containing histidine kinase [Flavobacteriales bacterium]|jgi:signal transduction histidine kinase|nr:HAMP domain-containing histidine kinase [Flavobacteriales bacterium]MBK6894818.1 HAMP domain-containing histidine kinase [Flavobacteriales bacterium]MBK7249302.1 HAMP domain-containing histidine kinase [Flavobacteriales bacterium]MBK7285856.1 HAMP domain-containing histidine kinase [Flavobacteriales bacterium]MBK9058463.1 HAMP domain-containing histidine kinase [Flavobacteriales bacterium]
MKLLQRTALYQALLALPMVVIGTAIGYGLVRHTVTHEVDEALEDHAILVRDRMLASEQDLEITAPDMLLRIAPGTIAGEQFSDTVIYDTLHAEDIPWRIGRFPAKEADGSAAVLTIGRSQLETDDLVMGIAVSIAVVLVLFTLCTLLLFRWLSAHLWRPFHTNLQAMERFRPDAPIPMLAPSDVEEFAGMAGTLGGMMANMQRDFTAQKRFTEQAAHELRTPLAILRGRLDQLIQNPSMGEREAGTIQGMYTASERMGRTISDMLTLAKVGDGVFIPQEVDWSRVFREELVLLKDPIAQRLLTVELIEEGRCRIKLHPVLAQLLVSNLLGNAVQHNVPDGSLSVVITQESITVRNTGPVLSADPASLFDRFAKGDPSSTSPGLGLSMVKEIAERNGLRVEYMAANGMHAIIVRKG